jgi:serine/threonine-protein kinase RsbW
MNDQNWKLVSRGIQIYKAHEGGGSKDWKFNMELEGMTQTHRRSLLSCISHGVPFVELRQSFPSHIQAISPFVEQLMHFIAKCQNSEDNDLDVEIALRKALANAVVHGNREDPEKRVYVACRCASDGGVSITVQDEGQGFDTGTLPDPTVPENRLRTFGRGIYLMKALMDEVRFEKGGAFVHMCKRINARSEQ